MTAAPEPTVPTFFEVRVHQPASSPGLSGLCAGYECGEWRCEQLAAHMIEWLPQFALRWSERQQMNDVTSIALLRRAALVVYNTDKYKRRGEFGELLLHAILRQVFNTLPAISKMYYKDSSNNTVKGFDCVHVVPSGKQLELWIGEVKFYSEIGRAIRDVVKELAAHTKRNYLRDEFALISNKIDDNWPHAAALRKLLDPTTSLDNVFARACIPVLLTYDSEVVQAHKSTTPAYAQAFTEEIMENYQRFSGNALPKQVRIHLFLLPLHNKKILVQQLHKRLEACQSI